MYVSRETAEQMRARLTTVLSRATLRAVPVTYAFEEYPIGDLALRASPQAVALVRDDEVWSQLVPSTDPARELFAVFRFHFEPGLDNSGFVGWLASHLKATIGTSVFVICGCNSRRGGVFDYWGCPAALRDSVLSEVRSLAEGRTAGEAGAAGGWMAWR